MTNHVDDLQTALVQHVRSPSTAVLIAVVVVLPARAAGPPVPAHPGSDPGGRRRALHHPVPRAHRRARAVARADPVAGGRRAGDLRPADSRSGTSSSAWTGSPTRWSTRPGGWASRGGGMLWRVELPLALPAIMAGVRVATVSTIGLLTIGGYLGVRRVRQPDHPPGFQLTGRPGRGGDGRAVLRAARRLLADLGLLAHQRVLTPWARSRRPGLSRHERGLGLAHRPGQLDRRERHPVPDAAAPRDLRSGRCCIGQVVAIPAAVLARPLRPRRHRAGRRSATSGARSPRTR